MDGGRRDGEEPVQVGFGRGEGVDDGVVMDVGQELVLSCGVGTGLSGVWLALLTGKPQETNES
jgi:hypothetical protein